MPENLKFHLSVNPASLWIALQVKRILQVNYTIFTGKPRKFKEQGFIDLMRERSLSIVHSLSGIFYLKSQQYTMH